MKFKNASTWCFALLFLAGSIGCGDSSDDPVAEQPSGEATTGVFVDSEVINIDYSTPSSRGVTDDGGRFDYRQGEMVSFHIGRLTLPTIPARSIVTPADMGWLGLMPYDVVTNITRLLHSLDTDLEPRNGITISDRAKLVATPLDFTLSVEEFANSPAVLALVQDGGQDFFVSDLVPADWALARLNENLLWYGVALDSDGDGVSNPLDWFPGDPNETKDTDGDGFGDFGDRFPYDPDEHLDSDWDGVGDNADPYPMDGARSGQPPRAYPLSNRWLPIGAAIDVQPFYWSEYPVGEVSLTLTVLDAPAASTLAGEVIEGAPLQLVLDAIGDFQFLFEVEDPNGTASVTFAAQATNQAPFANIETPTRANAGSEAILDGSGSFDYDGHTITHAWVLRSRPEGSAAELSNETSVVAGLVPDVPGTYEVELTVEDAYGESGSSTATLDVSRFGVVRLPLRVVDAVFRRSDDTLIMLGDDQRLYIYDTNSHETRVVSLSRAGTALAMSPDGTRAVVGHDGFLSHIDLVTPQVLDSFHVTADVFDVVLTDHDQAHVMPRRDQWENIRSINLATGEEALQVGSSVRAATSMELHPSGNFIYAADSYSIEKFDALTLPAQRLWESSRSSSSGGPCRDLWMSDDGLRIFTACGHVYRASDVQASDLQWNGQVPVTGTIEHVSHMGDEVLYLTSGEPGRVQIGTYAVLALTGSEALPAIEADSTAYDTEGRFVFHRADGSPIVIVQAEAASGLLFDYGLAFPSDGEEVLDVPPAAIIGAATTADIGDVVEITGSDSFDPDGEPLTYAWSLSSRPDGSAATIDDETAAVTSFAPDLKGIYQIELRVDDGVHESQPSVQTIEVEDPADRITIALDYQVLAADYSRELDQVVMVSESPARLIQRSMTDGTDTIVALPAPGTVITISPDGLTAAVGHDNSFTIVDLETSTVVDTFVVTSDIVDIQLPGNGSAYVFPRTGQWVRLLAVDLSTGVATGHTGNSVRSGTLTALHPSTNYIYGANNGLSPSDIEVYDISVTPPLYITDSPYHGDHGMCGNIWVTGGGAKLLTRCGNIFKANPGGDDDMTYLGKLNVAAQIRSASSFGDEIVIAMSDAYYPYEGDYSTFLHIYDATTHGFRRRIDLPVLEVGGASFNYEAQNVFHDSTGGTIIVVMQAEPGAGVLQDDALYIQHR